MSDKNPKNTNGIGEEAGKAPEHKWLETVRSRCARRASEGCLPQVEGTDGASNLWEEHTHRHYCGKSRPTEVGCPTDSGGGNTPILPREGQMDPFKRRDSINRTPPKTTATKMKALSISPTKKCSTLFQNRLGEEGSVYDPTNMHEIELTWDDDSRQSKRKRTELYDAAIQTKDQEPQEEARRAEMKLFEKFKGILDELDNKVTALQKTVQDNPNTKREIKEISTTLRRYTSQLNSREMRVMLDSFKMLGKTTMQATTSEQTEGTREEYNMPRGISVSIQTDRAITTVDQSTQTTPWHKQKNQLQKLDDVNDLGTWRNVEKMDWDQQLYTNTEIRTGNTLDTKVFTVKVVLIEPKDPNMEESIQRLYGNRYPELKEITGNFEVFEHTVKMKYKQDEPVATQKVIKINYGTKDEELWPGLTRLKQETAEDEWVAIHHVKSMNTNRLRKMVESIFHGTRTNVIIYTTIRQNQPKITQATQPASKKTRETYAMVIHEEGKDYRTLLENIKKSIANDEAKQVIRSVTKSKEGKVLITTDKHEEGLKTLQAAIGNMSPNIKVKLMGSQEREAIHIRGMDVTTTKHEIQQSLENRAGKMVAEEYKIGELRPNARETLAVTVMVDKKYAETLTADKYIRIGLTRCSIEKRIRVSKCQQCWSYLHEARDCNGPNRQKQCYKCGEEDHVEKDCPNQESCPICNESGHRAGSRNCINFRRALSILRRQESTTKQKGKEKEKELNQYEDITNQC